MIDSLGSSLKPDSATHQCVSCTLIVEAAESITASPTAHHVKAPAVLDTQITPWIPRSRGSTRRTRHSNPTRVVRAGVLETLGQESLESRKI
jgi:hypothetical protein